MRRFMAFILTLGIALCLVAIPSKCYALTPNPTITDAQIQKNWKSLSPSAQENARKMMAAFKGLGWSPEASAAWLGNAWQESTFNGNETNYLGTCSYFQMTNERKAAVLKSAGVSSCAAVTPAAAAVAADTELKTDKYEIAQILKAPAFEKYGSAAQANLQKKGITAPTPNASDKFSSVDEMKKTTNWYVLTWIICTRWERPGADEAMIGTRVLHAATVLKMIANVDPTTSGAGGPAAPSSPESATPLETISTQIGVITDEYKLEGMPNRVQVSSGDEITLGKSSDLSTNEQEAIQDMGNSFETVNQLNSYRTVAAVISFIGLALVLYSGIFLLGVVFDLIFAGSFSLGTRLVTFSRFYLWYGMGTGPKPAGTITLRGAIISILSLAMLGSLLLTGMATNFVAQVIRYIS